MMKFFKSIFAREQPAAETTPPPFMTSHRREVREAAKTGDVDKFESVLKKDRQQRHYGELSAVVEKGMNRLPPKDQADMLRHMAERVEKAGDRRAGVESAQERKINRVMTGNRADGLDHHKAQWIDKYRERAADRQAEPPQQKPRKPRMKP